MLVVGRESHEGATKELVQLASDLGIEQNVKFQGEVPIHSALDGVDVLLAPSTREGLPGVVIESVSLGVPVVASDIEPMKEVARQLAGVSTIPLADEAGWRQAVQSSLQLNKFEIRESFIGSHFQFERFVSEHRTMWAGGKL